MNLNKIIAASLLSATFSAHAIAEFEAKTIIKSSEINSNFKEVADSVNDVKDEVSSITNEMKAINNKLSTAGDYIIAKVNGIDMRVSESKYYLGMYNIITPTNININIYPSGNVADSAVYFENSDCSGQAYTDTFTTLFTYYNNQVDVGDTLVNPKITDMVRVISYNRTPYFVNSSDTIVKLNYSSTYSNNSCHITSGIKFAQATKDNDPDITGFDSFPLIIAGVGSDITISSEVGGGGNITNGIYNVYASGINIGTTTNHFYGADEAVRVTLKDEPTQTITLYKDGTYTGYSSGSNQRFYYISNDCTGTAYVKVLNDYDKEWWKGSKTLKGVVTNNGQYYELSEQIYKMSSGSLSNKSYYSASCSTTTEPLKMGYKMAITTASPNLPVFTPPITLEGIEEETKYDTLLEAY